MTPEEVTEFALSLPETKEDHPFGWTPDVYKVAGKIFAILRAEGDAIVSLKCDPRLAEMLRDKYSGVTPGYHLNKRHWNTVELGGDVPEDEIRDMIRHSYEQVVLKLPAEIRKTLKS